MKADEWYELAAANAVKAADAAPRVWVSVVDTRDQIVAVGATEHQAVRVAARRTLKYLRSVGASSTETNTIYKCAQYFAIHAVEVPVGEAVFLRG